MWHGKRGFTDSERAEMERSEAERRKIDEAKYQRYARNKSGYTITYLADMLALMELERSYLDIINKATHLRDHFSDVYGVDVRNHIYSQHKPDDYWQSWDVLKEDIKDDLIKYGLIGKDNKFY